MEYEQLLPTINMSSYTPPSVLPPDKMDPVMRRLTKDNEVREEGVQNMMNGMQQNQMAGLEAMKQPNSGTFLPGGTQ